MNGIKSSGARKVLWNSEYIFKQYDFNLNVYRIEQKLEIQIFGVTTKFEKKKTNYLLHWKMMTLLLLLVKFYIEIG